MTKKNITLTSIIVLILVIIIGIILSTAKPKMLGVGGLGLRAANVTQAAGLGGLSLLEDHALALDSQAERALQVVALKANAAELSGASLNLLDA